VDVLVICVLVFTVFFIVCTVFLYCFVYVLSVRVKDYCHQVTTQLKLVVVVVVVVVVVIVVVSDRRW